VKGRVAASAVAALVLGAAGLALADALGVAQGPKGGAEALALARHPAPPLAGTTLTGQHFDLTGVRGHVVLVTIWASWCPPCRQELPLLASTQKRLGSSGLRWVGVLTRDTPDQGRAMLASTGATAMTSVQDPDGTLAIGWGITGVPETFLVDPGGVVRARSLGAVTPQWITANVDPLVASAPGGS
jgi:cytochrome c biogenesis protein CcmG/thiol:disulfide interchange protein DsbE